MEKCTKCGTELAETDGFCKNCGKPVKSETISLLPKMGKLTGSRIFKYFGLAVIILVVLVSASTQETRTLSVQVPYQDPVYETRQVQVQVPYQDAVYGTFYSGTLEDTGLSTVTFTIKRATSYDKEIYWQGFLGLTRIYVQSVLEFTVQ